MVSEVAFLYCHRLFMLDYLGHGGEEALRFISRIRICTLTGSYCMKRCAFSFTYSVCLLLYYLHSLRVVKAKR